MTKSSKLTALSALIVSAAFATSALAAGDGNPSQRFIERLAGAQSYDASPSTSVEPAANPAQDFIDRLAGKQAAATEAAGAILADANPAEAFVARLAGEAAPVGTERNETPVRLTSWAPIGANQLR